MKLEELKSLLVQTIKDKDEISRDMLRLVVSDIESDYKKKDDPKFVQQVIRRHITRNDESLHFFSKDQYNHHRLVKQNELLESLVPKTLSEDEINTLLSAHNLVIQDILGANNEGQAVGVAMKFLKGQSVLGQDVKNVVAKLRENV